MIERAFVRFISAVVLCKWQLRGTTDHLFLLPVLQAQYEDESKQRQRQYFLIRADWPHEIEGNKSKVLMTKFEQMGLNKKATNNKVRFKGLL